MGIIYFICSIFTYGITFGYLQNKYFEVAKLDYVADMEIAFYYSLLGPFGLIISIYKSEYCKYGLKFF